MFDFWAEWCAPCVELDAKLTALAKAHPQLVIVRINVDEHHVDFDIPHLKVYDADGKLLWERTGGVAELTEALERLLR